MLVPLGHEQGLGGRAQVSNRRRHVAGWMAPADDSFSAVRWTAAHGFQDLGTLGGQISQANGINDLGTVVGTTLNGISSSSPAASMVSNSPR
jgi:uncharacterized membrane protein